MSPAIGTVSRVRRLAPATGAFLQCWRETAQPQTLVAWGLSTALLATAVGWLAGQSGAAATAVALAVGMGLWQIWRAAVFRLGFLILSAVRDGTLDFELLSPSPIALITVAKSAAVGLFYGLFAIGQFFIVILIAGHGIEIAHPGMFVVSVLVAVVAVVATAFIFAPLTFVMGGRPGFFNAVIPLGVLLGGFLYPAAALPAPVQVLAQLLGTSWAMDSVRLSIEGDGSMLAIGQRWSLALALSGVGIAIGLLLFRMTERAVRRTALV